MTIGPPSTDICWVCGKFKNNQLEPRFLYTVCEDHQDVPPVKIVGPLNEASGNLRAAFATLMKESGAEKLVKWLEGRLG